MITKVEIGSYRILGDVEAQLQPLTLIVGPNGCGKSTFLAALERASKPSSETSLIPHVWLEVVDQERVAKSNPSDRIPGDMLPKTVLRLRFSMAALREKSQGLDSSDGFEPDGKNLSRIIADYKLNDTAKLDVILEHLREVVPSIKEIKIRLEQGYFRLIFDTIATKNIPIEHMSDGTVFALGLLTALSFVGDSSALVLIDDIDQGLHPLAQKELVGIVRRIQASNPQLQIVATTHSPYLLACVQPQEVLCMHIGDDGLSRMAPLTSHPDFDRWKSDMNPGEFWSLFGDKWVAESKTAA